MQTTHPGYPRIGSDRKPATARTSIFTAANNTHRKTGFQLLKNYLCILCLICFSAHAQNLVPNPGFENYTSCPTNNQFPVVSWFNPNTATPDYFNPCGTGSNAPPNVLFGPQRARTGNSFAGAGWYGLGGGFYDYMQVQLTASMTAATVYSVSMWVSLADGVKWASDDVGIYISNGTFKSSASMTVATNYTLATTPTGFGVFNTLTPQIKCPNNQFITDTVNWTLVSGTYTAVGGENTITLGCFEDWATTGILEVNPAGNGRSYYFFDDVSVEALPAPAQPSAIAGPSALCALASQVYSVAPVSGASSYVWTLPPGWTGSSTSHTISVTSNTASGTLSVSAVNQGGQSSAQTISVTVTHVVAAVTQTAGVLYATTASTYKWLDCQANHAIVATGSHTFAPSQSGSYAVAISQSGCVDTSACILVNINTTSIANIKEHVEFSLYPNPADETLFLESSAGDPDPLVLITDCTGSTVYKAYALTAPGMPAVREVPIASLTAGVYFVQLLYPDKTSAIKKIIVIK